MLLDIKSGDPATYRRVTRTGRPAPTIRFAHRLADRGTPIWVRFVLVPGLTDEPGNVERVADIVAGVPTVERVEVLPFHRLGAAKYAALGVPFPLAATNRLRPSSCSGSASSSATGDSPSTDVDDAGPTQVGGRDGA